MKAIAAVIALFAVVVFWILLNRSTIGYEVRAVGFNPEAARYSGMSVGKNYILVMAVCGLFAGLAGSLDVLGWQFRIATNDIQILFLGYIGIAVALLGRNTAVGTVAALARAEEDGRRGRYVLQAAIAACHARARSTDDTDWAAIAALYGELAALCLAGAIDEADLLALSQARGECIVAAAGDEPGAMLAVGALALAIVAFLALTSLLGDGEPGSSGGPSAPASAMRRPPGPGRSWRRSTSH